MRAQIKKATNVKYSYADYLTWSDDERWELIYGQAYNLSPAPAMDHQAIVSVLGATMFHFLNSTKCKVFFAPVDVYFPASKNDKDEKIEHVVQPDIVVVCDEKKIEKRGIRGAPDVVVEIISPSSFKKDMHIKKGLYETFGVPEYWIVHIGDKVIEIYNLDQNGKYSKVTVFTENEKLVSNHLKGLKIDLKKIFQNLKRTCYE